MKEGINQLNEPSCFFTSCSPSMFFLVNSSQGFFYFVLFSFFLHYFHRSVHFRYVQKPF